MIDLKEIEKSIDEMIKNDTVEEMTEWLLKKKMEEYSEFLSEGTIVPLRAVKDKTFINPVVINKSRKKDSFVATSGDNALAA
jgi:hypothetical protein